MREMERNCRGAIIFFCALPFAQFVPLVFMFQAENADLFRKLYRSVGLESGMETFRRDVQKSRRGVNDDDDNDDADPLSAYIRSKFVSHIGFIVEAVVEAVPQSILQMVGIILFKDFTFLNIFSIFMSMSVVCCPLPPTGMCL